MFQALLQMDSLVQVLFYFIFFFDVDHFLKSLLNLSYIVSDFCFGFSLRGM